MNYAARSMLSFFSLNVGWWACSLGASNGYTWIGPATLPLFLGLHLYFSPARKGEVLFLAVVGVLGFVIDSSLLKIHFFTIPGAEFAPLWLVTTWILMGQTYESMLMLRKNRWLLCLSGAFSGPLSYYCFEVLHVLEYARPLWLSLAAHAVLWAALTPAIFLIRDWALNLAGFKPTILVQPVQSEAELLEALAVSSDPPDEDRKVLDLRSAKRSRQDKA